MAGLKAAITAANTNGQDDIINLAPKGTYTLTTVDNSGNGNDDRPNGLPLIGNDGGHSLTINGNGATIARSSAQGTPAFRFLHISGATVNISGVTITTVWSTRLSLPAGQASSFSKARSRWTIAISPGMPQLAMPQPTLQGEAAQSGIFLAQH